MNLGDPRVRATILAQRIGNCLKGERLDLVMTALMCVLVALAKSTNKVKLSELKDELSKEWHSPQLIGHSIKKEDIQ